MIPKISAMKAKHTLIDNTIEQRYELAVGSDLAVVEYIKRPGLVILTHTFVPERLSGQGIGREIVEGVLEDARRKGLKVIPQCSFVSAHIARHPEWEALVAK